MTKIESMTCFSIYALDRLINRVYGPLLKKIDLTYPQLIVLLVLGEKQEQFVDQLCTRTYLDTGTLTPLLKRLEAKDFVTRIRDIKDERRVSVRITPKGQHLLETQIAPIFTEIRCVFQLDEHQFNTLNNLLGISLKNIYNNLNINGEKNV
ncbi:MAG: MarR family transcriptional regulator [Alphaproteobacteria bacterium]|nr:MarR family transcriptional regulator [Alphaproteobacteria bacterium]